ncbi:MAG: tetratricopeptide repeat protein, partial [Holophagales bacterium]|nr:tetratricopeptide repeat protein [Holophagales bacterium]
MNDPARLLDAAKKLHAGGNGEEAVSAYGEFLDKHPRSAEAWYLLGAAHLQADRITDSITASKRAAELDGRHAGAFRNLGLALRRAGRSGEGATALRRAVKLEPDNADMHYSLGVALAEAARPRAALDAFKRSLGLRPGRLNALLGVGHCHRALGQQELAYKAYRTCLAVRPESAEAWWSIANLKLRPFDGDDLETIVYVTSRPDLSDRDGALMHHVLAKALEDAGRFDDAFRNYVVGAAIQRRLTPYDPRGDLRLLEEVERAFDRDAVERAAVARRTDIIPIFVVGLPRS